MREFINRIHRGRLAVAMEIGFLALLALHGWFVYRDANVRVWEPGTIEQVENGTGYNWYIDEVRQFTRGQGQVPYMTISGWIVERGIDTKDHRPTLTVILQNTTSGTYYRIPTTLSKREDVTAQYYENCNYDYSGYTCTIPCRGEIQASDADYAIYILVENGDGIHLVNTGWTVNGWIEAESQKDQE